MSIGNIINTNSIICTEDISLIKIYQLMQENKCDHIIVIESYAHQKPLGIITEHEICAQVVGKGREPRRLTAANVMNTDVIKVPAALNVADCSNLLKSRAAKRALVVNEDGIFCGTITDSDIEKTEQRNVAYVAPEFFGKQNYYKLNRIY